MLQNSLPVSPTFNHRLVPPVLTRLEKLLAVTVTLPRKVSLHTSRVVDNAQSMTPLVRGPIDCTGPMSLNLMGEHVMVTGIEKPLEIGDLIPLMLTFDLSHDLDLNRPGFVGGSNS